MSDNSFSISDTHDFFKNRILKYARARAANMKCFRRTTTRNVTFRSRKRNQDSDQVETVEEISDVSN